MLTIIHVLFDLAIYFTFGQFFNLSELDLVLLLSVNLIDLDHLWSRPIYLRGRDSFKSHLLHRNWILFLCLAVFLAFYRYTLFLGIGIMSHFLLDYLDALMSRRKNKQ